MKMNRREFLMGGVAAAIGSRLSAASADTPGVLKLGFQVFGVRDLCDRDFAGTLKAVREMGYTGVETGRFYGRSGKELRQIFADCDLDCFAVQLYPHTLTEPQLANTIRFCQDIGCRRINCAWFQGSRGNLGDWQLMINVLNHAAEVCAKEGIAVAYHNHDHEFSFKVGGKPMWDWLWCGEGRNPEVGQIAPVSRFSPRVVQELDCGNCVLGGGDPVEWIDRFPGRIPTVHVMPAIADATGLKPGEAGVGSVRDRADWPRILAALRRCGTEWLTVKPTAFPGSLEDVRASYAYLKGLLG